MPDLPELELLCLGPPAVRVDGGAPAPDVVWKRHLGLLIYLAMSPDGARTREQVMGMLWPEKPRDKARHSLNEAVRRCRASLGADRIVTDGERLLLNRENLAVDVHQLQALGPANANELISLLRGEFLEGFFIDDSQAFDEWTTMERVRVRDLAAQACVTVGERALTQGDIVAARALAASAMRMHAHSEAAVSLAMRAAALDQDGGAALSIYHAFAEQLEADIGEQPTAALKGLAERVRQSDWQRHSGKYRELEPRLVGRRHIHDRLFGDMTVDHNRARCFAIVGDPGSGKSRMMTECIERLSLGGAHTAVVRLLETDHDRPWSTLRALTRSGLGDAPGLVGADPKALRTLAGVIPELSERAEPREPQDQAEVADALLGLVSAVTHEVPLVMAIDEAQWADAATLGALGHVSRHAKELPLTVLVTSGSTLQEAADLGTLVERIGRDCDGAVVHLEPLSIEETEALVASEASWCTGDEERNRLARRISLESGGNVFLSVLLLRDLEKTARLKDDLLTWPPEGSTYDAPLPFSIPSLARVALVARLARLADAAVAVAKAASITGAAIDVELLEHLTGLERATIDESLDQLERQRIVGYTGARYVFNGRLLPEVIRSECVARGEQRRLRQKAIDVLALRDDVESSALRTELLTLDAQHEEALDTALKLVEHAIAQGAFRTAKRVLTTAERAAVKAEIDRQEMVEQLKERLAG